jgi:hypothetical protein
METLYLYSGMLFISFISIIFIIFTNRTGGNTFVWEIVNEIHKRFFVTSLLGILLAIGGTLSYFNILMLSFPLFPTLTLIIGILKLIFEIYMGFKYSMGYLSKFTILTIPTFQIGFIHGVIFILFGLFLIII